MRHWIVYIVLFLSYPCMGQIDIVDWQAQTILINQEKINTEHTEFSPMFWNDLIVFVASRPRNKVFDKNINEAFFDLYFAAGKKEDALTKTALFSKNINTPAHEGPITFSLDSETSYFTRTQLDEDNVVRNKIFKSHYQNNTWEEGTFSSLNFDKAASCHPTLGMQDQLMVFCSDRHGGFGKMDLYYSTFENGTWSTPKNMGPQVNSPENELFPFISDRGFLYFSSNRFSQNKGLNIFSAETVGMEFSEAQELPKPFNSDYDDFGFIIGPKGMKGYLSSNRPGGKGKDDIYYFKSEESLFSLNNANYNVVNCTVKDESGNPIKNCNVKFRPLSIEESKGIDPSVFTFEDKEFETNIANNSGEVFIKLDNNYTLIEISAPNKQSWCKILSGSQHYEKIDIILKNAEEPVVTIPEPVIKEEVAKINNIELRVGAVLVFNNIYYDYNSDAIKAGAAQELDQLALVMRDNNTLKIQLSAHTDSRGKNDYNQLLSERRALAAKRYLINKGVNASNIQTIGYGETKLRNHCKDGVKCSEVEHVYNRRTEVTVLEK